MTTRPLLLAGAALLALTLLAIFLVDVPLASLLAPSSRATATALAMPMTILESLFLIPLSKFAFGAAIVLVALVLFPFRRPVAWLLLYVGLTHLVTRLIAGVLKNVFLRKRPFEGSAEFFVDGGSAFPSGHAAHFWALFFALAIAFPRLRWPALVLAVLVSIARVIVNDHYLGDVLGSATIAALVAYALSPIAHRVRTIRPPGDQPARVTH